MNNQYSKILSMLINHLVSWKLKKTEPLCYTYDNVNSAAKIGYRVYTSPGCRTIL